MTVEFYNLDSPNNRNNFALLIKNIFSDKEEFLGHTGDYLKEDGTSERIPWAVSCYRNLFCEMYVYAKTKKYDCTSGDIQSIIDE